MKKCELCNHYARIYCQSDNASLCYNCDQTVHSSNFLVAKHSRTLLCHKCQSPTPWTASGLDLGRAATVCVTCLNQDTPRTQNDVVDENLDMHHDQDSVDDQDTESDQDTVSDDESDDDDEDEDGEYQVVPMSSSNIESEDDTVCSSGRSNGGRSREITYRPLKMIRSDRN